MTRFALPLLLAALHATSLATPAQDTVMGRMVAARADAPSVATTTHARAAYVLHCAGCHGLAGDGQPAHYVPGLQVLGRFLRLEGGRAFIVSVPGVMASGLDDRGVAEVMNWVLATLSREPLPAAHRPYTAAEVRHARAQPLVDVAAHRQQLLRQAQARGQALD